MHQLEWCTMRILIFSKSWPVDYGFQTTIKKSKNRASRAKELYKRTALLHLWVCYYASILSKVKIYIPNMVHTCAQSDEKLVSVSSIKINVSSRAVVAGVDIFRFTMKLQNHWFLASGPVRQTLAVTKLLLLLVLLLCPFIPKVKIMSLYRS